MLICYSTGICFLLSSLLEGLFFSVYEIAGIKFHEILSFFVLTELFF